MENKLLIAGLLFVFMISSGFWLSRTGRPLNTFILTAHKFISLGAVVFLVMTVYRIHQASPLSPIGIAMSAVTIVLFIVMIATGGLLSIAKTMPEIIHKVHQITPYLVILFTATTLYLSLVRKL
jgi:hypothetical protein